MNTYTIQALSQAQTYEADPELEAIARRVAKTQFEAVTAGTMGRGEFKRRVLSGEYPELVYEAVTAKARLMEEKEASAQKGIAATGNITLPTGYKLEIEGASIILSGPYNQDLHDRLRRAGGEWDGATGTNRRVWVIPAEKGTSLGRIITNWATASAKKVIEVAERQAAIAKRQADEAKAREQAYQQRLKTEREEQAARQARTRRFKVQVGRLEIGGDYLGYTVTGLGQMWSEVVPDEDCCAYGLMPGLDRHERTMKFQYAYCEKK